MDVSTCALWYAEARLELAGQDTKGSCLTVGFDVDARVAGWDVQQLASEALRWL